MAAPALLLTQNDYEALGALRFEIRRFLTFSAATARAAGLQPQQHQLLLAVRGLPVSERPTIRTLAERLGLRHHSAVELTNRCARRGLIARVKSAHDRREVTLRLTPRGARVLAKLSVAHREELGGAAPALLRALERIVAVLPAAQRSA